jgi:hypothetical protein
MADIFLGVVMLGFALAVVGILVHALVRLVLDWLTKETKDQQILDAGQKYLRYLEKADPNSEATESLRTHLAERDPEAVNSDLRSAH